MSDRPDEPAPAPRPKGRKTVGGEDDPLSDPDELEELGEVDEEARRYGSPDDPDFEAG